MRRQAKTVSRREQSKSQDRIRGNAEQIVETRLKKLKGLLR